MSRVPILDNGHGGVINGIYQTPGKRSPNWDKGILYEGMFNRWIINGLMKELDKRSIPYYHVSPELEDISLKERVTRANKIYNLNPNTYFISVHANAGGGKGAEVFTSPGYTTSDKITNDVFIPAYERLVGSIQKLRVDTSDRDKDKEAKFFVLTQTKCPAFLFEAAFMDNKQNYNLLWSEDFHKLIIEFLADGIEYLYKN